MNSLVTLSPLITGPALDAAVRARAEATGLAVADVRGRLHSGRLAVARRDADRDALEAQARALRALGDSALVLADDALRAVPPARLARGVRATGTGLQFLGAEGHVLATLPAGAPTLIVLANLQRTPPTPVALPGVVPDAADARAAAEARLRRLLAAAQEGVVLDVSWPGAPGRVRVRGGHFQFATLGDPAGPSAALNLRALVEAIARTSGRALLDLDFGLAALPARGLAVLGQPNSPEFDRLASEADLDFDQYSRFLHVAAAQGLYDGLRAALASAGAASWQPARVPAAPDLAPDASGSRSAAAAARARPWHPPNTGRPLARPLSGLGALGPPWPLGFLLGAAALAAFCACFSRRAGAGGFSLVPLGLAFLLHARALFLRRRRVEDVPTSRIRSAAVGPVEITGHAASPYGLRTPFSLLPCVYYEYTAVRETGGASLALPTGLGGLAKALTLRSESPERQSWSGTSGAMHFYVEDDTGSVIVHPAGALIDGLRTQVLRDQPLVAGLAIGGATVTVTERYIPVGFPLYVMGELRIQEYEPEEARRAAGEVRHAPPGLSTIPSDRLVLCRPTDGGPFLISERSERELVARLLPRFVLVLATGSALLLWGAWQLARFLGGA